MKIKLLIATGDNDYAEHLSNMISEKHADVFEINVCSTAERLRDLLAVNKFDAALLEAALIEGVNLNAVRMPLLLWDETEPAAEQLSALQRIRKYQRISSIAGNILENCAEASIGKNSFGSENAYITVVWSPAGGVGKTTVALAYATRKVADGKQVLYLDLEFFSSTPAYFAETGKSISVMFEKLESLEGNVELLVRSIRQQDSGTGITYFCHADNYDDINILSAEDIAKLIAACAKVTDELVIDMPCVCDERTKQIFEFADRILLVSDSTKAAQVKLSQFVTQHNVFERVRAKTALVANKGAVSKDHFVNTVINLPLVQSADASVVYKTLSGSSF